MKHGTPTLFTTTLAQTGCAKMHQQQLDDAMQWQWPWLFPTLLAAAAVAAAVWWERRRRDRLAAAADLQNSMVLNGDARGVYGDFLPAKID